ncbi:MAG: hypothetical protein AABM31_10700 [Actinomycetota bacterium]
MGLLGRHPARTAEHLGEGGFENVQVLVARAQDGAQGKVRLATIRRVDSCKSTMSGKQLANPDPGTTGAH